MQTEPEILLIRIDENLYFANISFLERYVLRLVSENPDARHLVINCNAINHIDGTALEAIESLIVNLQEADVTTHLSEVKGPVMDRLEQSDFLQHLQPGKVYLSTHDAVVDLSKFIGAPNSSEKVMN